MTPSPDARPAGGNTKVTREDWFDLAYQTLLSEGVESVRVLTLAQKLGVSRSSFYWYFESREDLLDRFLEHWTQRNTKAIVERAERPAETIIRGILHIFECWVEEALFDHRLEFAVREWARRSPDVRRAIDEADETRLQAISALYRRHGFDQEEAFVRARVLYYMQIGYYALDVQEPLEQRLGHLAAYLRSFSGQEPAAGEIEQFLRFAARSRAQSAARLPPKPDSPASR
ncbi:MAG: TetR/AcrR family transcriptional regulator [Mesorhizobium amorphae]|nr:MAG: TetR/AcrR family transcriptional regulator [Mesorhizobium amorphae]